MSPQQKRAADGAPGDDLAARQEALGTPTNVQGRSVIQLESM